MESRKLPVVYKPQADSQIFKIMLYISEQGYPERAVKFADKLYDFGNTFGIFAGKYPVCKRKSWAKRKWHCAVYGNYVFAYKVVKNQVVIFSIVHGKRLNYQFL